MIQLPNTGAVQTRLASLRELQSAGGEELSAHGYPHSIITVTGAG